MAREVTRAIDVVDDRTFVCQFAHFNGERRGELSADQLAILDQVVWSLQDGYGVVGYTPVQGWDWSGIRDSSPAAFANMAAAIREIVGSR